MATHLHESHTRDLLWWQLHLAVPRIVIGSVYGAGTGLITGLGVGFGGLVAGLIPTVAAALLITLVVGFIAALSFGFVVGFAWRAQHTPGLTVARFRGRLGKLAKSAGGRVPHGLLIGTLVALVTVTLASRSASSRLTHAGIDRRSHSLA